MATARIKIVDSPRPEDGKYPPLPDYQEMLGQLCDRFQIPGSLTFNEAMDWIQAHYTENK